MKKRKKPEFVASIKPGDEHYDLINNLWLYMSQQKDPYSKDKNIGGSVQEVDELLKEVSNLITKRDTFSITPDNYVETLLVNGRTVVVGLDDYGQCYYFEWYDEEDKQVHSMGCGTYNVYYKDEIEAFFAPEKELIYRRLNNMRDDLRELYKDMENLRKGRDYEE